MKNALKYDDSLDAFGIHAIGGIVGAIATGILVNPAWGGAGIVDYTTCAADGDISTCDTATYVHGHPGHGPDQGRAGDHRLVGRRPAPSSSSSSSSRSACGRRADAEEEGLDIVEHGERAYHA